MSADSSPRHETLETIFARQRDRLLAMVSRRIDSRLARRVGPQDVVQAAYLRAQKKMGLVRYSRSPHPVRNIAAVYAESVRSR